MMQIWHESLESLAPGLFRMHLRGSHVWLSFLNVGARIERWRRLNRDGEWIDLCLFYPDPRCALADTVAMGATIGRFANRIASGEFRLNGTTIHLERNEDGKNHLHGGTQGFGQCLWHLKQSDSHSVEFSLHSPDGDQGYPGAVDMTVRYELESEDQLRIVHRAICSQDTIINTTNHAYFNLHGASMAASELPLPSIMDHHLHISADQYLHDRGDFIPSGAVLDVEGTGFDFRRPRALSDQVPRRPNGWLNTTFVNPQRDPMHRLVKVSAPTSSWLLSVGTDAPGIIVYNGFSLSREQTFGRYKACSGLCIEPQNFPDCVNHPEWPSATVSPSQPYFRTIIYRLSERG
ncbi:aldose epimerase family protein [Herbaspirillum sp. RTI4]|uniref:aldose epimerase family protein n=1 Tax=Herbaspirillum sp. RTI4 TaxID=3048640 RepID=UPI002AB48183|nr:aldose epimerase family protein [Herbaspirillum sp. RTI4]MDY7578753.1 aldose epimerase family protein [Herbaspirillum sp. RTI4]MEA9982327.1 aldose epimerase family protein [Herbaspirillum sp. RTI4]